ncbi:RING-H2 finger protein ATL80-like [Salvia divinorum]|uniref:RING-H2 finger protein ATL80-like n=1 Tax=Salvia divinorum TaxID=28513 RepID=A0ABD1HZM8_SALDI
MGIDDWFAFGYIITLACLPVLVLDRFSQTTSEAPTTKPQRAADFAGLTFDKCTGKDGSCTICLDEYAAGERRATITDCSHRFHTVCLEKWIKINSTCPLCRHHLV